MADKIRNPIQTLIPEFRQNSNGESDKAALLFYKAITQTFDYDDFSNHPDYPLYASAETLLYILPLMVDEMLRRGDIHNFLVYPMISALNEHGGNQERAALLRTIATTEFVAKVLGFLEAQIEEPPIPAEEFNQIVVWWKNWKP